MGYFEGVKGGFNVPRFRIATFQVGEILQETDGYVGCFC